MKMKKYIAFSAALINGVMLLMCACMPKNESDNNNNTPTTPSGNEKLCKELIAARKEMNQVIKDFNLALEKDEPSIRDQFKSKCEDRIDKFDDALKCEELEGDEQTALTSVEMKKACVSTLSSMDERLELNKIPFGVEKDCQKLQELLAPLMKNVEDPIALKALCKEIMGISTDYKCKVIFGKQTGLVSTSKLKPSCEEK